MFVDVHSHMVPSGDDGVGSVEEGLELLREAARRGTRVLYATPHVWPCEALSAERERTVRAAHAEMTLRAASYGLELELGFELTPAPSLLEQEMERYRLGRIRAVLLEVPFHGALDLTEHVAAHIEACGFTPVIAHPERGDEILAEPALAAGLAARGCLLQVNASSLLGAHGPERAELAWQLLEGGLADLVASDGHRAARPPFLDDAYAAASERLGEERARPLFDGSALAGLVARDGADLAQRR